MREVLLRLLLHAEPDRPHRRRSCRYVGEHPDRPRHRLRAHPARCAARDPARARRRPDRAIVVHADTIGCMVRRLKDNGRLELTPVGTHSARFAEGAHVTIFTDDPTASPTPARSCRSRPAATPTATRSTPRASAGTTSRSGSTSRWTTPRTWPPSASRSATSSRSTPSPEITPGGFVEVPPPRRQGRRRRRARRLQGGAGGRDRARRSAAHLLVTIAEEVGHGATHGLDADVAEMVSVDNAVVAPVQQSVEERRQHRDARHDRAVRLPPHAASCSRCAQSTASRTAATCSATTAPTRPPRSRPAPRCAPR